MEQVRDRAGERIAAARTWGELVGALQGEGLRLGGAGAGPGGHGRRASRIDVEGEPCGRPSPSGGEIWPDAGGVLAGDGAPRQEGGGGLRRGDRGAPEGYRRVRPRARTLSERRSEGTAYDRMRRHVDRKAQRLFRGDSTLRRLHVDVQVYLKLCEREKDLEHARESTPRSGEDACR